MVEMLSQIPDSRLSPFVKMYFWGKDDMAPLEQRIVPNGEVGLCFYRNCNVIYKGEGLVSSCMSGQHMHYQDILSDGRIEVVGAHFTTLGAHLFFNFPMHEAYGLTLSMKELDDRGLVELEEQIMSAPDALSCWKLLDVFFLKRLEERSVDLLNVRRLQRALVYGQKHIPDARIDDVAAAACLSQRHFSRLFKEIVGLSPKDYMRLQRYHKTLCELKGRQLSVTEIAWKSGYYDFSHLSSDFQLICGLSPKQLLEQSKNDNDGYGWRL